MYIEPVASFSRPKKVEPNHLKFGSQRQYFVKRGGGTTRQKTDYGYLFETRSPPPEHPNNPVLDSQTGCHSRDVDSKSHTKKKSHF